MVWVDPLNPAAPIVGEPEEIPLPNRDLAAAEAGYLPPSVEADQAAIAEQVFNNLAARRPGWQAHDSNLDTWLIEAWAEVSSELRALIRSVPASIFSTYGQNVLGVTPTLAQPATGSATIVARDVAGYTLDAGSQFGMRRAGDDVVAFSVLQQTAIPPGEDTALDVRFVAVEEGTQGNELTGEGQMLDPVFWVQTITVTQPTFGGQNEETSEDYLNRLTNLMRVIAIRPVLALDYAIISLQHPLVGRSVALNMWSPDNGLWTNQRTVTLILMDYDGESVPGYVHTEVRDQLEALREINFVVHTISATYVPVDVTFTVVPFEGQDTDTVEAQCVANVTDFVSPARFRLGEASPAIAGGEVINPPSTGTRLPIIRVNDIVALLDNSLGVDHVPLGSVLINGTAADFTLPDVFSLPRPGTIAPA